MAENRIYQNNVPLTFQSSDQASGQPTVPKFTRIVNPPPGFTDSRYTPWSSHTGGRKVDSAEGLQAAEDATTSLSYYGFTLERNHGSPQEFTLPRNNQFLTRSPLLLGEDVPLTYHYNRNRSTNNTALTLLPSPSVDNTIQHFGLERGDPFQPCSVSDFEKMMNSRDLSCQRSSDSSNNRMFELSDESNSPTRFLKVSCVSRNMSIWVARDAFKVK